MESVDGCPKRIWKAKLSGAAKNELEGNNDEKEQKELTDEQKQETQGCSSSRWKNGLRPQHAAVPRPAGLVQDREELWRNQDVLTDMRPLTREPQTAPFGVGTRALVAGCGEVSAGCKTLPALPSTKPEDAGRRPGTNGLRPGNEGLRPSRKIGTEPSENWSSRPPPGILRRRIQDLPSGPVRADTDGACNVNATDDDHDDDGKTMDDEENKWTVKRSKKKEEGSQSHILELRWRIKTTRQIEPGK